MKKGWIFLLALLCVAFLVSCGKKSDAGEQTGELVRLETELQDRQIRCAAVPEASAMRIAKTGAVNQ